MNELTAKQISLFLARIIALLKQPGNLQPSKTLQSLERFENQLTLVALEECFSAHQSGLLNSNLTRLLSERWERIRNSRMCYTQQPSNPVNQLCLDLAKAISTDCYYNLLMPSIIEHTDIYGNSINDLGLHEFILSNNELVFIPIIGCLEQASISEEGNLRHLVKIDDVYPELTCNEIDRVSCHSTQAAELYQAVIALNTTRLHGSDIGAKLSQLARRLRGGGAGGSGSEFNAGSTANIGIIEFFSYWEDLPETRKKAILTANPGLKETLGRLSRPNDESYQEVRFCVELLAAALDPIIAKYSCAQNIQKLKLQVQTKTLALTKKLANPADLAAIPSANPPKHILHHIYDSPLSTQRVMFKEVRCENALMYALAHDPEALLEFTLDSKALDQITSTRVNNNGDTALIVAAKHGKVNVLKLLINEWRAKIELGDVDHSTALHWAAINGHVAAVSYLLDHGAQIEATGLRNDTALNLAVMFKQRTAFDLLLQKNARLNARNSQGKNALDLAFTAGNEYVDPILMQIARLSMDEQAECLLNVRGGIYQNVLFYAAANKPALFDELIGITLKIADEPRKHAILMATNGNGYNPLILAAQLGALDSIRNLLGYGIWIESPDVNESTALHWAANNGRVTAVNYLLDHGANIEALGDGGNTALHFAVIHRQRAAVDLLIQNNASVTAINKTGKLALHLALSLVEGEEFVTAILMQMARLPMAEQSTVLLVPSRDHRHNYDSALTCAAIEQPSILKQLFKVHLSANVAKDVPLIEEILNRMHFDAHLQCISDHYQLMKQKSQENSNYLLATAAAKTLLTACVRAKVQLYDSNDPLAIKIGKFQENCNAAIKQAKPVLKKYREWGKVLAVFILAIITLPVSLPLYAVGFFSVKTKSEQLLDKLHEAIALKNNPAVCSP